MDHNARLDAEVQRKYNDAKSLEFDLNIHTLRDKTRAELVAYAGELEIEDPYQYSRNQDLVRVILQKSSVKQGLMYAEGVMEVMPEGFGFLRESCNSYLASADDIYVSLSQVKRFGLRHGQVVQGWVRPPKESERYFALLKVDAINGRRHEETLNLRAFEDLEPHHPESRYLLETEPDEYSTRVVDLIAPIGRGQRALVVSPPRVGKTVLLQKLANGIITNHPEAKVLVLLIDERPEEVTEFRRNTPDDVEVVASTFDEHHSRHVEVSEMVIEKARRMVEFGDHVVILLDSITRMARAYNNRSGGSGRILSGGLDAKAMERPRRFFSSARAIDGGGSLTIVATALVETNSRMDEVIFEEFKGTGNSEIRLDRRLAEKRVFPAIDIVASGTRRDELLMDPMEFNLVSRLRRVLCAMNPIEAMDVLLEKMSKTRTNAEFLLSMTSNKE